MRARNADMLDAVAAALAGTPSVAVGRSRLRHRLDAARAAPRSAAAAELAAGRQRSQPAGAAPALARPPDVDGQRPRRSISCAISKRRSTGRSISSPRRRCSTSSRDEWLDRLVTEAAARRLPVYAALSYDGLATLDPVDPLDPASSTRSTSTSAATRDLARRSARRRRRPRRARFEAVGYTVTQGASDWVFGPKDRRNPERGAVPDGRVAAREIGDRRSRDIIGWLARRRDHIEAGRSSHAGRSCRFLRPADWRRAEPRDRNRAALPRRSDAPASASAAPDRRGRSAQASRRSARRRA